MKVYVVLPYYDYEGYGEPKIVTVDLCKAEQFIEDNKTRHYYYEIITMELQ